ncbi:hypothetical protein L1049_019262 [Liquidambar formosana]|uniref:Uncharacterized protein n=1 Tax=Liquidambar formosana TaxID=63359 RepID=A0AAP0SB38_LIQFO
MDEYCRRSGQIPAFGNWDYANELPITQYFESARQAGLLRYSSSSGECDVYMAGDLYAVNLKKPSRAVLPPRKTNNRGREKRSPHVKEAKKQGKVCDVTAPPRKQQQQQQKQKHQNQVLHKNAVTPTVRPLPRPPKPVDEDLYKIPPELLHTSKRKKKLGFLSRCLVPGCAV